MRSDGRAPHPRSTSRTPGPARDGRFGLAWPLGVAIVIGLAACGEDTPDPQAERDELIAELRAALPEQSQGALDDDAAACVAERLVERYGHESLEETVRNPDAEGVVRNEVITIFGDCDALAPLLDADTTGRPDTTEPDTTDDPDPDTTGPDDGPGDPDSDAAPDS